MRPVIDIRNVHRIFESEAGCVHILHNVSLAVDPGEFVCHYRPFGLGQTTLMNILGCLDKPTAGDYYLQGLNVAELDDDELTRSSRPEHWLCLSELQPAAAPVGYRKRHAAAGLHQCAP